MTKVISQDKEPVKKWMTVTEMGNLLGLKKTDRYWLVHKNVFETKELLGKMRVNVASFEKWYANQVKYHKVTGEEPGSELKEWSYSIRDIAQIPSLSIPAGAVVGIIGNNGSGKTTFARCLCGLERKATGEISIEGEVLNRKKRLKNSYLVMQDVNHRLFTESVEEEVLIGMPGGEEKNRPEAENILKSMDLLPLKELHPLSLSGGQKQRVAVASALSSRKKILC